MSKPKLVCWFSADLVGSTEFKTRDVNMKWLSVINGFYTDFMDQFKANLRLLCENNGGQQAKHPELWKLLGDEILFSGYPESSDDLQFFLSSFIKAVSGIDHDLYEKYKLGVKGTVWCGLTDIPNARINSLGGQAPDAGSPSPEKFVDATRYCDFVGPDVDTGFRIANAFAEPGLVMVAPKIVKLLAPKLNDPKFKTLQIKFRYEGAKEFKGVARGLMHPVFSASDANHGLRGKWYWQSKRPVSTHDDCLDIVDRFHEVIEQRYNTTIYTDIEFDGSKLNQKTLDKINAIHKARSDSLPDDEADGPPISPI